MKRWFDTPEVKVSKALILLILLNIYGIAFCIHMIIRYGGR